MPRGGSIRTAMVALCVVGLGIAGYLTIEHYTGGSPVCAISHGCETVQHSRYATLGGVPVAVIGLIGYAAILASLLVPAAVGVFATVWLALVGWAFSLYLTYREVFTIHAICQWCVGSAVVMTLLLAAAVVRFLREEDGPREVSIQSSCRSANPERRRRSTAA
jgi:uncharacterized membrane protein